MKQSKVRWSRKPKSYFLMDCHGFVRAIVYRDAHQWWGVGPLGTAADQIRENAGGLRELQAYFTKVAKDAGYL